MDNFTLKDLFTLHGLSGFFIAVVGLLLAMAILLTLAMNIQQEQSQNYYSIDTDINKIKSVANGQEQFYNLKSK
jgi:succinate dehydrogenase/fumarate reductase cytochrome b subunit